MQEQKIGMRDFFISGNTVNTKESQMKTLKMP